jgi:signal transduction histidine kinase/CheY-like chemotaxis protein/PAS domain-containing protein
MGMLYYWGEYRARTPLREYRLTLPLQNKLCNRPIAQSTAPAGAFMNSIDIANRLRLLSSSVSTDSVEPGTERLFHCSFRQREIDHGECILADTPTGRFISVDTRFCEFLGFPRNALLAINLRQLMIDPGYSTALPPERLLLAGEIDRFAVERLLVRSDGTTILTTLNCRELAPGQEPIQDPLFNQYPSMSSLQPMTGDTISAPLIHELPLLVGSFLSGGIAEYISSPWSSYTGIAGNDLLGLQWLTTIHPDDRKEWQALFDGTAEDAMVYDCRIRGGDGRYRWFQVNILLNVSLPDERARWTATCTPVEERRRSELHASSIAAAARNLFNAEGRLEIVTSAADAIVPALADWCRIDLFDDERSFAETFVVHHDVARQQAIHHLALPQMDHAILTPYLDDEAVSSASNPESGSLISVPLIRSEEIIGYIYAGADDERGPLQVSDMQCVEQIAGMTAMRLDREHRISRLSDDHAAKDRFIAVLGHELRTPLAAVQTALEVAVETPLPETARTSLEIAQRNILLEITLLNDLLDVTRIRGDKLRLDLSIVDVHDLLRNVLEICRQNSPRKQLQFELELRATHFHVAGDQTRLHQVFWNLLKNAIMHTEPGREIHICTKNHLGELVVEVDDNGIGLNAKELAMIQELFAHHMDRWPVISDGLGLGLSICASLVELHHGTLSVESEGSGTGASFTVALPFVEHYPGSDVTTPTATPASDEQRSGRPRILLVDDNVDMITVYRQLLQHRGYEVTVAYTMSEALELGKEVSFDLLISDIGLPDGDGIKLMENLAEQSPVRAIAVSGYGTYNDIQRSLAAGYALHLVKPFSVKSLCEAIETILDSDGE